jgi:hypothetical protein
MPVYEIGNPSDAYTMKSDCVPAAAVACMFLGEGAYNLTDKDGKQVCPFFLFGGDPDAWLKAEHNTTIEDVTRDHGEEVIDALETVLIGDFAEREVVESATAKMSKADAAAWLEERHDRKRSSMNNIGRRAKAMAAALRKKQSAVTA